eukprot:32180_3
MMLTMMLISEDDERCRTMRHGKKDERHAAAKSHLHPSSGWRACQPLGLPEQGAALHVDCSLRATALRPALQNIRDP